MPQPGAWAAAGSPALPLAGLPAPRRSGTTAPAAAMAAQTGADEPTARNAEPGDAGRMALAQAMSRYAGVIRDAEGLERLLLIIAEADSGAGAAGPGELGGGAGRERHALVLDDSVELEAVEAANLRTVSLLIAAGAARRAESRGCHRRRDAGATGTAPWHTLLRWDGRRLVVAEELVTVEEAMA
jgi:aspartate oxidase